MRFLMLSIGIAVNFGSVGCGQQAPPSNAPPRTLMITPAGGGPPAAPVATNPTLDYWQGLNGLVRELAPDLRSQQPAQVVAALRVITNKIQGVPTVGVDLAVVNWGLRVATLCEQKANFLENSNASAVLLEAFLRGANGDPFGMSIEQLQAVRQWEANCQAVRQEGHRLRAAQTARYGIEFPPCAI